MARRAPMALPIAVMAALSLVVGAAAAQDQRSRPLQHLERAAELLDAIPVESLPGDARRKVTTLRRNLPALIAAYRANPNPFVAATVAPADLSGDPDEAAESRATTWKGYVSLIERDLTSILSDPSFSDEVPAEARQQLHEVRLETELFFAAAILSVENEAR